MLTKKFTDFSADLLDTVRGVLGEAKKCKECGCAKCECEDEGEEDDMEDAKEGYVPTSDEPTEANKKTADKVRALLAKEKKPVKEEIDDALEAELKAQRQTKKSVADAKKKYGVKEEAEQIDELSDALLKNYSKKALAQSKTATGDQKLKRQVGARNAIDRLGNNTLAKEEVEQIDELSKATMGRYINKAKNHIDAAAWRTGYRSAKPNDPNSDAIIKAKEKQLSKRHKGISTAVGKLAKEEVEQIDELSKKTLGSYVKKAAGHVGAEGLTAGLKIKSGENPTPNLNKALKRQKGIETAANKLTKEEQDFIDSLNAMDLEEARGRPKKAGGKDFTIHPKTKEKLMHNNPEHMKKIELLQKHGVLQKPKTEAAQHIINQLQKAKTSMTGGATIHFTHGDSKHVSGTHAAKVLDKYAGMKPNEKEDFQKKIGHSHENLMKHV